MRPSFVLAQVLSATSLSTSRRIFPSPRTNSHISFKLHDWHFVINDLPMSFARSQRSRPAASWRSTKKLPPPFPIFFGQSLLLNDRCGASLGSYVLSFD